MSNIKSKDPVTVGVVTHERTELFGILLEYLKTEFSNYDGECTLIVANNSGADSRQIIADIINASTIERECSVLLLDTPTNNIAQGRNIILDATLTKFLLFLDDDEYPTNDWISLMLDGYYTYKTPFVAGPIVPNYPQGTPLWIKKVDLHNKGKLKTGDITRRAATGNCLIEIAALNGLRFDERYGRSGGEDSKFFETLFNQGKHITWLNHAAVQETILPSRSTPSYLIFKFLKQGQIFRRYILENSSLAQKIIFYPKAVLYAFVGILVGLLMMPFNSSFCAYWMKRGFTNLGKLTNIRSTSYG